MGNKGGQGRRKGKKAKFADLTTYTTQKGMTIKLIALSQIMIEMMRGAAVTEFREAGEPIATPTYEAKTVAGDIEELPLDEKSLEVKGDEEETKRRTDAWAAHEDALERLMAAQRKRVLTYHFGNGIDIEIPGSWEVWMKKYGIEVPEDPEERMTCYIMTSVLPSQDEMWDVTIRLTALANNADLTPEMLAAAEATFRNKVRTEVRDGDTSEQSEAQEESVVV